MSVRPLVIVTVLAVTRRDRKKLEVNLILFASAHVRPVRRALLSLAKVERLRLRRNIRDNLEIEIKNQEIETSNLEIGT